MSDIKAGDVLTIADRGGRDGSPLRGVKRVTVTAVDGGALELHAPGYGAAWWDAHGDVLHKRNSTAWVRVARQGAVST